LLSRIDVELPETQVLVLAPTRELAIQVSESFQKYGQHLRGLRVAPIYGGSSYATQINALRRGAHVVVGTPGRVMDHMRESRLRLDTLRCLVLDEADEMLRMGFVDDVQWILEQSPEGRQIALFSATMPDAIRQIANRHLKNPHVVSVASKQRTADTIEQRFAIVEPRHKPEALRRILEAEQADGMIIFVKTKIATVELADHLRALGYEAVALNGDIAQSQRERTIEQLKDGTINILVATDVAARGLDVQRISHVINYDLPADAEAYVHRIGRTGRAGRSGQAIVLVAPKQRGFLRELDRAAGQSIEPMAIPTAKEINALRVTRFKERIVQACTPSDDSSMQREKLNFFEKLVSQCAEEHGLSPLQIASGLATLAQGERPFFVNEDFDRSPSKPPRRGDRDERTDFQRNRPSRDSAPSSMRDRPSESYTREAPSSDPSDRLSSKRSRKRAERDAMDLELAGVGNSMETFRVEVGKVHGVKPGNLVGAVANEIGLDSQLIGPIRIHHDFSTIDLPSGMPRDAFKVLGRAWVVGRQLRISKSTDHPPVRKAVRKPPKSRKP
jgi:ATP-dependent RNA helicase DeaD